MSLKKLGNLVNTFTIVLVFMLFLLLVVPLNNFLEGYDFAEMDSRYISGIIVRIFLSLGVIILIKKHGLSRFSSPKNKPYNLYVLVFPLIVVGAGFTANWEVYLGAEKLTVLLFFGKHLSVGLFEEVLFRGFVFPKCLIYFKNKRNALVKSSIMTGSLFGFVHLINLFREPNVMHLFGEPDFIFNIISQVFAVMVIGVFLAGILVRTGNIIFSIFMHFLINSSLGSGELRLAELSIPDSEGSLWLMSALIIILFAFIFIWGLMMLRESDTKRIYSLIEGDN
mgnify:CR=1 FL=1|tara:strand:+ start:1151 stop:1993 length:843 start_codon:yes stop_codon:yes gene_type:complete